MVSFALVVCLDSAAALAQAWDGVQEEAVGGTFESGGAGDVAEDFAAEEQPAEDEGQAEESADGAVIEPNDNANVGEAEPAGSAAVVSAEIADGTEAATPTDEAPAVESEAFEQAADEAATQAATYAHTATAEQSGVKFTVGWDDASAGTDTTFHVTQTGGTSFVKARMDMSTYWGTDGSSKSVCDSTRSQWAGYYELGDSGCDFRFELTVSVTYYINFYFMDTEANIWYLRTTAVVEVNDEARPSETQIVNNAVAQCSAETAGSEYDAALWLHDWVMGQLEYDHSLTTLRQKAASRAGREPARATSASTRSSSTPRALPTTE